MSNNLLIESKIRIGTIVFILFYLIVFSIAFIHSIASNIEDKYSGESIALSMLFGLLFIGGLGAVITFWKRVKIFENKIEFYYPLLFRNYIFEVAEIEGYCWKKVPARIDYKCILIKSKSGQVFRFSDFEIKNLRELEGIISKKIEIMLPKWKTPTSEQKTELIESSLQFDLEQLKDIRLHLIFLTPVCLFLLVSIIYELFNRRRGHVEWVAVFILFVSILSIMKLIQVNKKIKNFDQHNANVM